MRSTKSNQLYTKEENITENVYILQHSATNFLLIFVLIKYIKFNNSSEFSMAKKKSYHN